MNIKKNLSSSSKDIKNNNELKFVFILGKVSLKTLGMPGWFYEGKRRGITQPDLKK